MGTSTTVMAPVGPDTCTFEPPNTVATRPATTAVMSPAKHGQLRGQVRQLDPDQRLQFPDRALTIGEDLKCPNPGRMGQRPEQLGLELRDRLTHRLGALGRQPIWHDVDRTSNLRKASS